MAEFLSELQIMAPLSHPNLVQLIGGSWENPDELCIVLELCVEGSLSTYLGKIPRTWTEVRCVLAVGAARGLRYLHHELPAPLIHRDIKPDNILVGDDIVAKLADFGVSTRFDTELAQSELDAGGDADVLTMTMMVGTELYCKS